MFKDPANRCIYEERFEKKRKQKRDQILMEKNEKSAKDYKIWQMSKGSKKYFQSKQITYENVEERLMKRGQEIKAKIVNKQREEEYKIKEMSETKQHKGFNLERLTQKKGDFQHKEEFSEKLKKDVRRYRGISVKNEKMKKNQQNHPSQLYKFTSKNPFQNLEISSILIDSKNERPEVKNTFNSLMNSFKSSKLNYGPYLEKDVEKLQLSREKKEFVVILNYG